MFDLACFGFIRVDQFIYLEKMPPPNSGIEISNACEFVSGDAAIVALHASSLGLRVALCGNAIGSDSKGLEIQEVLADHSIELFCESRPCKTPTNIVMQDASGNRTWFGFNCDQARESALTSNIDAIERTRLAYVDGYFGNATKRVVQKAIQWSKCIILNMAEDDVSQHAKVNIIPSHKVNFDPLNYLINNPPRGGSLRIVTMGEEGAMFASSEGVFHHPAYEATPLSPSGAGAAFSAGVCYSILDNLPLEELARVSCACGAIHCSGVQGKNLATEDKVASTILDPKAWKRIHEY